MIMLRSPVVDVPNAHADIHAVAMKTIFKRVDSSTCPLLGLLEAFIQLSKICIDSIDISTTRRFFKRKRRNWCSNLYENIMHWGKRFPARTTSQLLLLLRLLQLGSLSAEEGSSSSTTLRPNLWFYQLFSSVSSWQCLYHLSQQLRGNVRRWCLGETDWSSFLRIIKFQHQSFLWHFSSLEKLVIDDHSWQSDFHVEMNRWFRSRGRNSLCLHSFLINRDSRLTGNWFSFHSSGRNKKKNNKTRTQTSSLLVWCLSSAPAAVWRSSLVWCLEFVSLSLTSSVELLPTSASLRWRSVKFDNRTNPESRTLRRVWLRRFHGLVERSDARSWRPHRDARTIPHPTPITNEFHRRSELLSTSSSSPWCTASVERANRVIWSIHHGRRSARTVESIIDAKRALVCADSADILSPDHNSIWMFENVRSVFHWRNQCCNLPVSNEDRHCPL